ncbi:hypothetical protein MSKOL_0580 [Methanosarcina sp. Kolksee]|uniref:Uncharacterized protein n=1 Tax=Methanosarcina vacuolata Z-761 TaxID=1434123 RepID=A0A0E3Q131_9EURY|nr:hypothetical protein MSVAZ_0601 [Methanosarcina vacuolata Z-761]AKB46357.1 hypothetical protein MSKOL_0580 [Methanosarcina sp. Kolksee]
MNRYYLDFNSYFSGNYLWLRKNFFEKEEMQSFNPYFSGSYLLTGSFFLIFSKFSVTSTLKNSIMRLY